MKAQNSNSVQDQYGNKSKPLLVAVDLLTEWVDYGQNLKAKLVHRKCLINKKYNLARKIEIKYKLVKEHDDSVMAFQYALYALNGY